MVFAQSGGNPGHIIAQNIFWINSPHFFFMLLLVNSRTHPGFVYKISKQSAVYVANLMLNKNK